jgi:hypothetical protein
LKEPSPSNSGYDGAGFEQGWSSEALDGGIADDPLFFFGRLEGMEDPLLKLFARLRWELDLQNIRSRQKGSLPLIN